MPSTLRLAGDDLARLVARGLGDRVRSVQCTVADGAVRFTLTGLDASRWLPRLDLDIAVEPILHIESQHVELRWQIRPSSLTGMVAVPAQHLGVGAKVIDALIDRLGWQEAVVSRDNSTIVIALCRLAALQRLGVVVRGFTLIDALVVDLALA